MPAAVDIKPVESDEELRLATDLMRYVHEPPPSPVGYWLAENGFQYPGYRREHTRIALLKGQVVGALRLTTDTLRIGEARLKMGGLGWVTTHPAHRHKGICRALMNDAIHYMAGHGYHVSMLFGIPDMYERFGYTTTLAKHWITVKTPEALTFDCTHRSRQAKPGDLPAIQRMHDAQENGIACSLLRSTAHLKNKWRRWDRWQVLTDDQGKVTAYFYAFPGDGRLEVTEVGVGEFGLCAAVLRQCGQLAQAQDLGELAVQAPPPHPFAHFMLQFKSQHVMQIDRDAGGMMRFIDLSEALECMVPEWESLLAKHPYQDLRTECTIVLPATSYRIRANRGAVDVAATNGKNKIGMSERDLMHLLTGYRYLDDVADYTRNCVSPSARALLAACFPKRCPFVWHFDRF